MTKNIHHVWLGSKNIPQEEQKFIKSWRTLHPDYNMQVWTDEDAKEFDIYMELVDRCTCFAQKADVLRYCIIQKYGGIYTDTDIECIKPLDDMVEQADFFTGFEDPARRNMCNALFYAHQPNYEIVNRFCDEVKNANLEDPRVSLNTGPGFITPIVRDYWGKEGYEKVFVFDREYFHPRSFHEPHIPLSKRITDKTRTIHYWNGSWLKK